MRYPIVNWDRPRVLGQAQETEAVRKARILFEKVQAIYPNLVSILGKEKADQGLEEARANLEKAQKEVAG